MLPLTFILLAAAAADHADAQRAALRIQQAQYCAAVERRAQHREVERVQPMATADVKPTRDLSGEERAQLRQALEWLARCATGNLVYDHASGFYVPEQREGCR
ncbi:MAG: hypothetical protein M1541_15560 [Acidobacteria bacterium]|nr:hypothetical protein [Acidobacteriota bacterium]